MLNGTTCLPGSSYLSHEVGWNAEDLLAYSYNTLLIIYDFKSFKIAQIFECRFEIKKIKWIYSVEIQNKLNLLGSFCLVIDVHGCLYIWDICNGLKLVLESTNKIDEILDILYLPDNFVILLICKIGTNIILNYYDLLNQKNWSNNILDAINIVTVNPYNNERFIGVGNGTLLLYTAKWNNNSVTLKMDVKFLLSSNIMAHERVKNVIDSELNINHNTDRFKFNKSELEHHDCRPLLTNSTLATKSPSNIKNIFKIGLKNIAGPSQEDSSSQGLFLNINEKFNNLTEKSINLLSPNTDSSSLKILKNIHSSVLPSPNKSDNNPGFPKEHNFTSSTNSQEKAAAAATTKNCLQVIWSAVLPNLFYLVYPNEIVSLFLGCEHSNSVKCHLSNLQTVRNVWENKGGQEKQKSFSSCVIKAKSDNPIRQVLTLASTPPNLNGFCDVFFVIYAKGSLKVYAQIELAKYLATTYKDTNLLQTSSIQDFAHFYSSFSDNRVGKDILRFVTCFTDISLNPIGLINDPITSDPNNLLDHFNLKNFHISSVCLRPRRCDFLAMLITPKRMQTELKDHKDVKIGTRLIFWKLEVANSSDPALLSTSQRSTESNVTFSITEYPNMFEESTISTEEIVNLRQLDASISEIIYNLIHDVINQRINGNDNCFIQYYMEHVHEHLPQNLRTLSVNNFHSTKSKTFRPAPADQQDKVIALGNLNGTISLIKGDYVKEYQGDHKFPIRKIVWVGSNTLMSFGRGDRKNIPKLVEKNVVINEINCLNVVNGTNLKVRQGRSDSSALRLFEISGSGCYLILTFHEHFKHPPEIWNLTTFTLIRRFPKNFPKILNLAWNSSTIGFHEKLIDSDGNNNSYFDSFIFSDTKNQIFFFALANNVIQKGIKILSQQDYVKYTGGNKSGNSGTNHPIFSPISCLSFYDSATDYLNSSTTALLDLPTEVAKSYESGAIMFGVRETGVIGILEKNTDFLLSQEEWSEQSYDIIVKRRWGKKYRTVRMESFKARHGAPYEEFYDNANFDNSASPFFNHELTATSTLKSSAERIISLKSAPLKGNARIYVDNATLLSKILIFTNERCEIWDLHEKLMLFRHVYRSAIDTIIDIDWYSPSHLTYVTLAGNFGICDYSLKNIPLPPFNVASSFLLSSSSSTALLVNGGGGSAEGPNEKSPLLNNNIFPFSVFAATEKSCNRVPSWLDSSFSSQKTKEALNSEFSSIYSLNPKVSSYLKWVCVCFNPIKYRDIFFKTYDSNSEDDNVAIFDKLSVEINRLTQYFTSNFGTLFRCIVASDRYSKDPYEREFWIFTLLNVVFKAKIPGSSLKVLSSIFSSLASLSLGPNDFSVDNTFYLLLNSIHLKLKQLTITDQNRHPGLTFTVTADDSIINSSSSLSLLDEFKWLGLNHLVLDYLLASETSSGYEAAFFACVNDKDQEKHSPLKMIATSLIATGNFKEGISMLCAIGKYLDACVYLQAYGHWEQSMWLAKMKLDMENYRIIVEKYANHLQTKPYATASPLELAKLYVHVGGYGKACEYLYKAKKYETAYFLYTGLSEFGIAPAPSTNKNLKEEIEIAYVNYLLENGNQKCASLYFNKVATNSPEAK